MSSERISVIVEELLEVLRDEDNPVLPAMLGTALDEDLETLTNDEKEAVIQLLVLKRVLS